MNILRKLKQFAVYWAPLTPDRSGATQYAAPIELPCRWEDSTQEMIDPRGDKWTTKAEVFTAVQLTNLGILWKGRYADLVSKTDPMQNPGASAIRSHETTPGVSARETLYSSFL